MADGTFKLPPFAHQREWLDKTADLPGWAVHWDQGTGKTKFMIDLMSRLYREKKIDAVIVVAPPGVHLNWVHDELPTHCPDDISAILKTHVWNSGTALRLSDKASAAECLAHPGMSFVAITYDGFMTAQGKKYIWKFLQKRRVLYILDEADNIKAMGATRTKSILASGKYAAYRRTLTGTPVTLGPFDAYSQIKFVDPEFWKEAGFDSYSSFKTYFGKWGTGWNPKAGKEFPKLEGYQNLERLEQLLRNISCRVLKDDVLDLPPKVYSKRRFELTALQMKHYRALSEEYTTELSSGAIIDADLAIVRMLRYQQITSGYLPGEDGSMELLGNRNPRIEVMEEIRDQTAHQALVWARFTQDIDQIMDLLGPKARRYDGKVDSDTQLANKQAFQRGEYQWLVLNQQAGGAGLTLHKGKSSIYYSNSFRLRDRLQSEDRNHRAGMDADPVNYIDLIATGTIDEHIVENLRKKRDIAAIINGETLREWI